MREISKGDKIAAEKRLVKVRGIMLLEFDENIEALGDIYFKLFQIPERSKLDSYHLALAVWHKIEYLLSWNCKHIANAIVNNKLREYNDRAGLYTPILCTPEELMEE